MTVRGTLEASGQRLDGAGHLHLLTDVPLLLVGGGRDPVIPVAHTEAAHRRLPGSWMEIFDDAGHFPHAAQPERFTQLLSRFVAETAPAATDPTALRRRILGSAKESPESDTGRPEAEPPSFVVRIDRTVN
jgi:predicted dienelactone hydrolase